MNMRHQNDQPALSRLLQRVRCTFGRHTYNGFYEMRCRPRKGRSARIEFRATCTCCKATTKWATKTKTTWMTGIAI